MSNELPDDEDVAPAPDPAALDTARLEREIQEVRQHARQQITLADLKVAAVRAGMVDLDGIKLLDMASVQTSEDGRVTDAASVMQTLRRAKPWLFGAGITSSLTDVPPSQPPRQKLATEMSDEEYRAARALILKKRI